ncbi:MAG: septation protein A [Azoarcus sp.]|jgi:intracellular septation protein|nr:septation protein A [Azoarcus sp.]
MKLLLDLLPVIFFFGAYKLAGVYPDESLALAARWLGDDIPKDQAPILIATFIAIVATALQIGIVWLKHRKVDRMLWVSLIVIATLGGATLAFHDATFIKWKPTVFYWLLGAVLFASSALFQRNLIKRMLEAQIRLPESVWSRLNLAWALFFALLGVLNLYVAYHFSEDAWVNFKLFGCTALILVFSLAQGLYLSKHVIDDDASSEATPKPRP